MTLSPLSDYLKARRFKKLVKKKETYEYLIKVNKRSIKHFRKQIKITQKEIDKILEE